MTAEQIKTKYPEMPESEVKKMVEIEKKLGLAPSVDWDAMICESCQ